MVLLEMSGKACIKGWQARSWQAVPCTIDSTGTDSYGFRVSYVYFFNGQMYKSWAMTLNDVDEMDMGKVDGFSPMRQLLEMTGEGIEPMDSKEINALSSQYSLGGQATCYVNPQQPAKAVLDRTVSEREVRNVSFGTVLLVCAFAGLAALGLTRK
jgi:hypothetical protein